MDENNCTCGECFRCKVEAFGMSEHGGDYSGGHDPEPWEHVGNPHPATPRSEQQYEYGLS